MVSHATLRQQDRDASQFYGSRQKIRRDVVIRLAGIADTGCGELLASRIFFSRHNLAVGGLHA